MTDAAVQGTDIHVARRPRADIHRLMREREKKKNIVFPPSHAWCHKTEQRHPACTQ